MPTVKQIIAAARERVFLNTDYLAETVRYYAPGVEPPTELPAQVFRDWETGERVPGANVAPVVNEDHGKRISRFTLVEVAQEQAIHIDGMFEIWGETGWERWAIVRRNEADSGLLPDSGGLTGWLCQRTELGTTRRTRPRHG